MAQNEFLAQVQFSVEATFSPAGECKCTCCEFRQYLRELTIPSSSHPYWNPDENKSALERAFSPQTIFTEGEDCEVWQENESGEVTKVGALALGIEYSADGGDLRIRCFGRKDNPPPPPGASDSPEYTKGDCEFRTTDSPAFRKDYAQMRWSEFIGRIIDVCNQDKIVAEKRFVITSGRGFEAYMDIRDTPMWP
jgi:hypothetical protein